MKYLEVNDTKIPAIGLGTYKIRGSEACLKTVDNALQLGYRLFDTAQVYKNEADLGKSFEQLLPKHNLERKDIFITTKIAPYNHGDKCVESVETSLRDLRTNYLDLVLIHWPGVKGMKLEDDRNSQMRKVTYQQLENLHEKGTVKLIGLSNYTLRHMNEVLSYARVKPHLLQSEFHPLLQQKEVVEFCRAHSIVFQAYSSLGTSDRNLAKMLVENELICEIAQKNNKTSAQILLKWAIEQNIGVIPKSENVQHLKDNIELFGFELTHQDMEKITGLEKNQHFCWNPETVA